MRRINVLGFSLLLFAAVLLAMGPALANLQIVYKARLSDPSVRGVSASAILETNLQGGFSAMVAAHGLDPNDPNTQVWIGDGTNSLPLCGYPGAAEEVCPFDSNGNLSLWTSVTSGLLASWHYRGSDFLYALNHDLLVATITNSAGNPSGVFHQIFP